MKKKTWDIERQFRKNIFLKYNDPWSLTRILTRDWKKLAFKEFLIS